MCPELDVWECAQSWICGCPELDVCVCCVPRARYVSVSRAGCVGVPRARYVCECVLNLDVCVCPHSWMCGCAPSWIY